MTDAQPFRTLIVGVGSIGERHLRCFQNTGRCKLSFCEVNAELREEVADRYQVEGAYSDVNHALKEAEFDVAVIAAPASLHIPLSLELARHDAHLLIEKPLSTSLDGIDQLRQVTAERQLATVVGYTHRAHPLNLAAKQWLDAGKFGRPLQAVFHSGQHFPFYRPAYREIYYADRRMGGGAVQDAITHVINLGEWLLGPIDRLVTDAAHQSLPGVQVEDTVHTLARHGPILASYALNQYQAPNSFAYTVVCEGGTLRVDYVRSEIAVMVQIDGEWEKHSIARPERDDLFIAQANRFLDVCEGRAEPFCSLAEGLQTLRVNLASLRSIESETWQHVS